MLIRLIAKIINFVYRISRLPHVNAPNTYSNIQHFVNRFIFCLIFIGQIRVLRRKKQYLSSLSKFNKNTLLCTYTGAFILPVRTYVQSKHTKAKINMHELNKVNCYFFISYIPTNQQHTHTFLVTFISLRPSERETKLMFLVIRK